MTKQEEIKIIDEEYLSKWIEAEYQVMGWPKVEDAAVEPIIKE